MPFPTVLVFLPREIAHLSQHIFDEDAVACGWSVYEDVATAHGCGG